MTTLQSFQSEIDQIHARETNHQRLQAALDKEKEANTKKGAKSDAKAAVLAVDVKPSAKPAKADAKIGKVAAEAKPTVEAPRAANDTILPTSPLVDKLVEADDDRVATTEEEIAEVIVRMTASRHDYLKNNHEIDFSPSPKHLRLRESERYHRRPLDSCSRGVYLPSGPASSKLGAIQPSVEGTAREDERMARRRSHP